MLATRGEGLADGPVAVLLHGLTETMRCWERVVPLLTDRFRVVLVDLPGHGASSGGGRGVAIESYAESVAETLRREGVERAVVAGHSLGGAVAVALAEAAPELVERIVLVNSPPTYDSRLTSRNGPERLMRQPVLGPVLWRAMPEKRMRDGFQLAFAPGYEVPPELFADLRATPWSVFAGATIALDGYLSERDLGQRVASVPLPVTVVFGDRDQRVEHGSLAVFDDAENATVVRIPEAGHTPIWETPERAAELIARDG
jgi:pimeloyl-ACP methyl ester carboxylesterase